MLVVIVLARHHPAARRIVVARDSLDVLGAGLAAPVGDDLAYLFLADPAALDAARHARGGGQQEHVAFADQLFGSGLIEDDPAVGQ